MLDNSASSAAPPPWRNHVHRAADLLPMMGETELEMTDHDTTQFLDAIKDAAVHIGPETAEVTWWYGQIGDPYGVDPETPDELWCIGRLYYARSPGSEIWVCFRDLPEDIASALWEKHRQHLAFPAGLSLKPEEKTP